MCSEKSALGRCISIACGAIGMHAPPLMLPSSHFPVSTRHYTMICAQEGTASKECLLHVMACWGGGAGASQISYADVAAGRAASDSEAAQKHASRLESGRIAVQV